MPEKGAFSFLVGVSERGERLDAVIVSHLTDCSRSHISSLIQKGLITVNGLTKKPGYRIKPGEKIAGHIPPAEAVSFQPEPIEINILYEDNHLIIINKQPGMVVHPAPGNYSGTLVNALLYHCPDLEGIGGELRPGIVHRLDKDTSGVIAIAKNQKAHSSLASQFKSRKISKTYLAIVYGTMRENSGIIAYPIGRHPTDRKKMSTISNTPRSAKTFWKVIEQFDNLTLLELDLKTGRTHQARVHCAAISHAIVGDPVYGSRKLVNNLMKQAKETELIKSISRQLLHAWKLKIIHPDTNEEMFFEAPVPDDMRDFLDKLRSI